MKNVIVLTTNEQSKNPFLMGLGMHTKKQEAWMCMIQMPTKIFNYQIFGLLTVDKKLSDYIKSRDGIIILLDTINDTILERINTIVHNSPFTPIAIILNTSHKNSYQLDSFTKVNHRQLFINNNFYAKEWFNNTIITTNVAKSQIVLTSINIPIQEMAKQFQDCTMPLKLWDHYGRLRIVYYAIMKYGFDNAINSNGWLCTNWFKYKTSIGHGNLWHYTLTRFWACILYSLQLRGKYNNFADLYEANPFIHNGSLFKEYYTDDVLFTAYARNNWVPPNKKLII